MSCFAEENPIYLPAMRLISDITRDRNAQVTTTFHHDFTDGLIVRFYLPDAVGMRQLHRQKATITATSDTTFTIDVDTREFDAFSIPNNPTRHQSTCAQVVPVTGITRNTLDPSG